jgi:hypothetical protein
MLPSLKESATSDRGPDRQAPPSIHTALGTPGSLLDAGTRTVMEAGFGRDFSSVRVHSDPAAAASARMVGAMAFTVGNHIVVDPRWHALHTGEGRRLLAHELAHVVQQVQEGGRTVPHGTPLEVGEAGGDLEHEAQAAADSFAQAPSAAARTVGRSALQSAGLHVARQPVPAPTGSGSTSANDLSGTPFANFHPRLKTELATKFDKGSHATLAAALDALRNEDIASMARVGSRVSDIEPGLWDHVKEIKGGWITDNYGIGMVWKDDAKAEEFVLTKGSSTWCKDDPVSALAYHGTTHSTRQVPDSPGLPGLHAIFHGAKSDVHIDLHQPLKKGTTLLGYCQMDVKSWKEHAADVELGGGARATPLGRYAGAKGRIAKLRDTLKDPWALNQLKEAEKDLKAIEKKVTEYAARGKMVGTSFEGDQAMAADKTTMEHLEAAEHDIASAENALED